MMTWNVTQTSLDIATLFRNKFKGSRETKQSLRKLLVNIGGFLGGCLMGGIMAKVVGLTAVGLPGVGCFLVLGYHQNGRLSEA
jgi:hypothetical protein